MKLFHFIVFLFSFAFANAQGINILVHSHNDYEQAFPLTTAMSYNFKSIEVDVFEVDDQIVVCHDSDKNLHLKPTLKELYLEPLSKYPFKENQTILLLIDLKMEGGKILNVLHSILNSYVHLFKTRKDPNQYAPIQIILSGSVDKDAVISNDSFQYFFVDGRVVNLDHQYDSQIMPIISSDFEDHISWKPGRKIPKLELKNILNLINAAHSQGKIFQFWNTPDTPEIWDLPIALKVDLIGVDEIERFMDYRQKFESPQH